MDSEHREKILQMDIQCVRSLGKEWR